MLPICLVHAETRAQVPEDVRLYLHARRRRSVELEPTEPPQRRAELEAANRNLQGQLADALTVGGQPPEPIRPRQRPLADSTAQLNAPARNSSLPPASERVHGKRRPPPPLNPSRQQGGGRLA